MTSRAKQELLKECDEQIKMCNTMSFIGGCDTIAQYKIKKPITHRFFDLMRYRLCVYASGTFNHFFLNLLYVLANCPQAALISLP